MEEKKQLNDRHFMKSSIFNKSTNLPAATRHVLVAVALLSILLAGVNCRQSQKTKNSGKRIVIEVEISKYFYWQLNGIFTLKDVISIRYAPIYSSGIAPTQRSLQEKMVNGKTKWTLYSDEPLKIIPPFGMEIIMFPGDSVHISYPRHEVPVYSGSNSSTFELLTTLMRSNERTIKPIKYSINASTLSDYLEWNQYLNKILETQVPIIETYKTKIPTPIFEYYKSHMISTAENERVAAFKALRDSVQKGYADLTFTDLNAIWDSTHYKPYRLWINSLPAFYGSISDLQAYNRMEAWRKFSFDLKNDSLRSKDLRNYQHYMNAKYHYKELTRERLQVYILDEVITKTGIKNPVAQKMLQDYYSQPGFREYKDQVKMLEKNAN